MSVCFRNYSTLFNTLNNKVKSIKYRKLKYQPQRIGLLRNIHIGSSLAVNVPFKLSDIGEGIREVVVKQWYINVGDKVAQFDKICEVQSDKASVTITSRYDGVISKLYYSVDDIALVGNPLVDIDTVEDEVQEIPEIKSGTPKLEILNESPIEQTSEDSEILAIPSVRRLAKEFKIDLTKISGTGKNGRILKEDVLKYLDSKSTEKTAKVDDSLIESIEPVKGFKKAMVKSMTHSLKLPTMTYSDEISVTKLIELRNIINSFPELEGTKLSFMPFLIKAISNALLQFPIINASYDEENESIIYKRHHNIGVAIDTKIGLAIPAIKKVQQLDILDIAKELQRLLEAGKNGTFSIEDTSDVTILISNIGIIGGTYLKPVPINNTSSIIAFGKIRTLPRFDSTMKVVPEEIVNMSCSTDHRIIEGATLARFCNIFKRQIENPYLLLLKL